MLSRCRVWWIIDCLRPKYEIESKFQALYLLWWFISWFFFLFTLDHHGANFGTWMESFGHGNIGYWWRFTSQSLNLAANKTVYHRIHLSESSGGWGPSVSKHFLPSLSKFLGAFLFFMLPIPCRSFLLFFHRSLSSADQLIRGENADWKVSWGITHYHGTRVCPCNCGSLQAAGMIRQLLTNIQTRWLDGLEYIAFFTFCFNQKKWRAFLIWSKGRDLVFKNRWYWFEWSWVWSWYWSFGWDWCWCTGWRLDILHISNYPLNFYNFQTFGPETCNFIDYNGYELIL